MAPVAPVPQATIRPLGARVHRALDRVLRLVQQAAHAAAGEVVLGVRVRVDALQRLQVALEEDQAAARGGVVAVDHQAAAERRVERRVDADDLAAEEIEAEVVHGRIVEGVSPLYGKRCQSPVCPRPGHPWPGRRPGAQHRNATFVFTGRTGDHDPVTGNHPRSEWSPIAIQPSCRQRNEYSSATRSARWALSAAPPCPPSMFS